MIAAPLLRGPVLLGAFTLALPACGIEREAGTFEDQTFDVTAPSADAGASFDVGLGEGVGAGTLGGTWLMAYEGSTCVLNQEQLTYTYYLVEIEEDGRTLRQDFRLCAQEYSELLGLQIVLSEAARGSIVTQTLEPGLISDLRVGGTYSSGTLNLQWGLELADPVHDAIPTDPDDPRVVDADQDGEPGITFEFAGSDCRRYTGQNQLFRFDGNLVTPNAIEGRSINLTELVVYGSSETLCGVAPPVRSNDGESRFRLVRVDGLGETLNADRDGDGVVDCDEVADLLPSVIEQREADPARCRR